MSRTEPKGKPVIVVNAETQADSQSLQETLSQIQQTAIPRIVNQPNFDALIAATNLTPHFEKMAEMVHRQSLQCYENITEQTAKLLESLERQQTALLEALSLSFEQITTAAYPGNIRAVKKVNFDVLDQIVMGESIALYGVPSTPIVQQLLGAAASKERRLVLNVNSRIITSDSMSALDAVNASELASFVEVTKRGWFALDDGHPEAAQALAASIVDALTRYMFGEDRVKLVPSRNGTRTKEAYDDLLLRNYLAFAPLWGIYQQFLPDQDDCIPETFSRHATAHTVGTRQYTKTNAIQALLFVTSLLIFLQEYLESDITSAEPKD